MGAGRHAFLSLYEWIIIIVLHDVQWCCNHGYVTDRSARISHDLLKDAFPDTYIHLLGTCHPSLSPPLTHGLLDSRVQELPAPSVASFQ